MGERSERGSVVVHCEMEMTHLKKEFQRKWGGALAVAQHMDKKASWPWYGKLFHWAFVSWRCPACRAEV